MLFNSLDFLIFFPIVVMLYFMIPHKYRWILLLAGSYYFYMCWKPEYIVLIILSTLIDYMSGWQIHRAHQKAKKVFFLCLSLLTNLGLLFSFKYLNFFSDSIRSIFEQFSVNMDIPMLNILLPVGISFYTFQTLSYTIDIYKGKIKPEKHFGIFAVYVSFFPQLVAGPIERAKNLLPQFAEKHNFDYKRVTDGLKLMLWGFFKKIVIADGVAAAVGLAFDNPGNKSGAVMLLATLLFAFQIFCDFSGYSDIAIGAAQVLGFKLMTNFRRPYHANSISDFWARWHISLSTWFRDYLYIPLGGNRVKIPRWYLNVFIVFLVSGLWHGANWTFVVWGALHGFYLVFSLVTKKVRARIIKGIKLDKLPKLHYAWQMLVTFVLVNLGWIFFRAKTIQDAWLITKRIGLYLWSVPGLIIAKTNIEEIVDFANWETKLKLTNIDLGIIFGAILLMELVHVLQSQKSVRQFLSDKPRALRWAIYIILIMSILIFAPQGEREFIYFQF
jgi:alginate O-acetyltransferase complex protein AlgI